MAQCEIKSWIDGRVLYSGEAIRLKDLVVEAVKKGADLSYADLSGANLSYANLSYANLSGADLSGADLSGADLSGADLSGANLSYANLSRANLSRANLSYANLSGADLSGANLSYAKLGKGEVVGLRVFSGLYKYRVYAYVLKDSLTPCVRMGCHDKTLAEWDDAGGVSNVNREQFPGNDTESKRRVRAFEYAKAEALAMVEDAKNAAS